ncbi:MAG: chitobiase/beta-hexosaminidase C-terminal domain-containing protein, partial [Prevotella sp.]|nr:chitobiase/beta-hexosaminidase C-terminal domain-containing protein [Prevotella sp.]
MKRKLRLLMTMLLMAVMGNVSGAEKTITLDYSSFGLTTSYAVKTATVDGFGFTVDQGYKGSGNVIQMNSSKGSGILYNTTAISGLKSITVNVSSGSKTYTITTGTSENPTANSQTGTATGTYNAASGDTYFQLKVSGASYFSSIVVTYEDDAPEQVSLPTFNPVAGEVARGTVVTFNCATEGVSYYYTIDGSTPTIYSASANTYTVNEDVILKVIAVKEGMNNSSVATAAYTIAKADPNLAFSESSVTANIGESFTPPTLTYAPEYDGTITYTSSNSAITVNSTTGEVTYDYSAVGKTTTITASASETDNYTSGTASYVLTVVDPNSIQGNLNNATFGTNYTGSITPISSFTSVTGQIGDVTVTYAKGSSSSAYVNDNEIRLYNGIELTFTAPDGYYIKSLTFNNELALCESNCGSISGSMWSSGDDNVSSVTITRVSTSGNVRLSTVTISLAQDVSAIAKPTITPSSGTYTSAQTVSITNNAEGAIVYYTTDGNTPTTSSNIYSNPFTLSKSGTYTIKAIAVSSEGQSSVASSVIVINIHVDAPVFSEADGTTFDDAFTIHLTAAEGTTIYYTTGSASPVDEEGNLTSSAIAYNASTGIANLSNAVTINAIAIDQWGNVSEISTASYKYIGEVTLPYYENFDEGLGNFTTAPDNAGAKKVEWVFQVNHDVATYGEERKYAFITGGANSNKEDYVGEDRLISPILDLSNYETISMNFVHAGHWFGS